MTATAKEKPVETASAPTLTKKDPASPAIYVSHRAAAGIKAGTSFNGTTFDRDTPVTFPSGHPVAGIDYAVVCDLGALSIAPMTTLTDDVIGGFHFAPGGTASARAGGDDTPAINPFSVWDRNFRPACDDPRGMARVESPTIKPFWCDIYLTSVAHFSMGTSKLGVPIADGDDCPVDPSTGKAFECFDYETARKVMAHHGKGLLSFEEFACAAIGVTEKTAADSNPKITKLDAARTSRFGLMQATGNMWVWGHDGDPDAPRASIFGGSWLIDVFAGSRCALVDLWPGNSNDSIGARGRSDHLQPV